MNVKFLLPIALLLFVGCNRTREEIKPQINYAIQDRYLRSLPSPFSPLTADEKATPWGQEYQIAIGFAHQLDLYQSMTSFKRAYFLAPPEASERRLELRYDILLSYYLGRKYDEVIDTYENTELRTVGAAFPAAHDLLVMLYDSYLQVGDKTKADQVLESIEQLFPKTEEKLILSTALKTADFPYLEQSESEPIQDLLFLYNREKKSVGTAQTLNAILPGSGYLYLGQKQTALTAFLLNGLFIAAAYHFFNKGQVAAGIATTGFEIGWYFGGITGAREEATFFNARVYERHATPMMNQDRLFPVFMLSHAF